MKKFNICLLLFSLSSSIYANNQLLSKNKIDILNYDYEKSIQDNKKLKNDWINPIVYKFIYNHGEDYDTQKSLISISQPIFKSGGIYYAIKYANSMEKYSKTSIDIEKNKIIKQIISLAYQLRKIDISIHKQLLLIKNSKLDIERKKDQVLNGLLDTSFLDNAILNANIQENGLTDLIFQKESLMHNLEILSDKKYTQIILPILNISTTKQYDKNNIYIKKAKENIKTSYWMKNMLKSNYFPTINFTADYTKYHKTDGNVFLQDSKNIGLNLTIPLDIKYEYVTTSSKIAYLQKKSLLKDQIAQEKSIYKTSLSKLKNINKKITIAKSNIKLYNSLLIQIKEQFDVGMKTQSDLDTIINSKDIKILDVQTLNIDKQLELLELYSRMEIKQ